MSNITLGADPEIVFREEGGLLSAANFLPRQHGHDGDNPEFGGDGHPEIAELRTKPCNTPQELIEDIRRILTNNHHMIPDYAAWMAGSFIESKPIGGHIHFGGIQPQDNIVEALHGYVAQIVLLLEDEAEAKSRRAGKYGRLDDEEVRTKAWGFEYRPLPSWIISPSISLGVVALAKAVVHEEIVKGPSSLLLLKKRDLKIVTNIDTYRFNNADKSHFGVRLDPLMGLIRKFEYWRTDEGADLWKNVALLKHIALKYPDWHNEKDILHRWKIRDATPASYKINRRDLVPVFQRDEMVVYNNHIWDRIQIAVEG